MNALRIDEGSIGALMDWTRPSHDPEIARQLLQINGEKFVSRQNVSDTLLVFYILSWRSDPLHTGRSKYRRHRQAHKLP